MSEQATATAAPETPPPAQETAPTPPVEAAPAPAPAPEPPPSPASPAFAALAKKERAFLEAQKKFRAEQEAFKAEAASVKEALELIRSGKGLEGLERLGVDYTAATKSVLGRPLKDPAEEIKADLEALKQELKRRDMAAAEHEQTRAIAEVRGGIAAHLKAAPDEYPVISATPDGIDQVYALIQQHAYETAQRGSPELLDFAEAAKAVEAQLRAGLEILAPVFARLHPQSVPQATQEAAPATDPATTTTTSATESAQQPAASNGARTLSNSIAAESAPAPQGRARTYHDVEQERIRRALRVISG